MKSFLASSLGLLTVVFVSQCVQCKPTTESSTKNIVRRQEREGLYEVLPEASIKKANVQSIRTLPPKINKNAIRKQVRFGPYLVPGSKEPSVGTQSSMADVFGAISIVERIESLCDGDCTILGGGAVPEFENGTALSEVGGSIYNHHIFATNRDRLTADHICPGEIHTAPKTPGTFIGGGTDQEYSLHTSADGTFKSGYEIKYTDKLDLIGEFMNYRLQSQKIILALDFEYLPGRPEGYLNSQTAVFSATATCNQTNFDVPAKQYSTTSKEWIMPVDGYIISIRGHEHDGGTGVHVFVNGKNICSSVPTYTKVESKGESEEFHFTIKEMSLCSNQVKVSEGDALTVRADYDTEKYPQRMSNMGHAESVVAMAGVSFGLPSGYELP